MYGKGGIYMVTAAYAFAHFAVDLACAFAVFSHGTDPWDYFLYNLFAFAMQMPLGLLADLLNKNRLFALTGAVLVGICSLSPALGPAGMMLLGLGNGLFHIGGGLDVMNVSGSRAAPFGVFVSPGALGVYLGTALGKSDQDPYIVLAALLLSCIGMLFFCKSAVLVPNVPIQLPKKSAWLPALLLFLVVALRSVGGSAAFGWRSGYLSLAAVGAVVFGKALGGVLSDRFGMLRVSLISLLLGAFLFFFADRAAAGLAALLLFNMTMPITLFALSKLLPSAKGFSFGLLTFALFVGFLPGFFGMPPLTPAFMTGISLVSCALLVPALKAGDRP